MTRAERALEALLSYSQADEDGIMVVTSRQAIHEVADELRKMWALWEDAGEMHRNLDLDVESIRNAREPET